MQLYKQIKFIFNNKVLRKIEELLPILKNINCIKVGLKFINI